MDIKITVRENRVVKCVVDGVNGIQCTSGHRTVFNFDNKFVVKFDSGDGVRCQNEREAENFTRIAKRDRRYFAKILSTGKIRGRFYIVQEFVENTKVANEKTEKLFSRIRRKYAINDCGLSTACLNHHNVVLNDKGFKIYDLGWERAMPNLA